MRLSTQKNKLSVRDLVVFAVLGSIMFLTTFALQALPNIHLLAMFIAAFTLTYRARALIPLYVFILLDGVFYGFALWWLPYLYIWLPLWGAMMLAGRLRLPRKVQVPLYMVLCGLHGLSFGTLYAPAQALMFGLSFQGMITWIIAGLPMDLMHGIGDFASAVLVLPLHELLKRLEKQTV
ncbi:MAG: hypothetical protein ACOYJR_04255 [Acutalibacteraceae bacterium]|jgi:hypothetical protein